MLNKIIRYFLHNIGLGGLLFSNSEEKHQHTTQPEEEQQIWTCSMHPQIRKTEAGKCPICGMDLIPLSNESGAENPMEIKMSPTAMQLANIQTSVIKKQKPVKEVRMNGKIKADERLVFSQSAHLSGRIEKLLVNFTGESVSKGQTLAYIYSPELVTAQEELFEALKIKNSQPALFEDTKAFKPFQERVFIQHCPMANNNSGADWISKSEEILNSYFGASMLNCRNME
ncbi:MAG: efflux RND transporter periplasmic adaptor subunit [bacterium]